MSAGKTNELEPTDAMLEAGAECIGMLVDDEYSLKRIKAVAAETWAAMNAVRVKHAQGCGVRDPELVSGQRFSSPC